ncbi:MULTISPECIES: hypothetical protein [unclassified Sphingopyxis]|uniref:hypothetical protein n=1 Tax=unclassified Sphingopyxis TaxID=2614943 RepID=UPI00138F485C|nr:MULTISPECIES: hypothetical protein [unclassified Sphingopyxis]
MAWWNGRSPRRSDRPFIFRPASKCARPNGSTPEAREGTARRAGRNGRAIKCCVLEGRLTEAAKIEPARGLHGTVVPRIAIIAIVTLLLAACDRFPSDPEQSLESIRSRGTIRLGAPENIPPEASALLRRLEKETGARTLRRSGEIEPLLQAVEDGDIDLVIAPFRKDTPSATANALSPPIRTDGRGDKAIEWRAAMPSGENRWISLVEVNARQVAGRAK